MKSSILCISASPRRSGNSDIILEHIIKGAESQGAQVQRVYLRDLEINSCIGCEKCRRDKICTAFDDDMQDLYDKIEKSRGLAIVSPVYNYNITAWAKIFIDRLYCFYDFEMPRPGQWSSRLADRGKKAVTGIVGEQHDLSEGIALPALRLPLEALGYEITKELNINGVFNRSKVAEYPLFTEQAYTAGIELARNI